MKTFKLFSMAALALTMAACSNEDSALENVTPAQQGTMHFTATVAAPGSGATTRTTYTEVKESTDPDYGKIKVAWNVGDQIALVHNGVKDVAKVMKLNDDGSATIDADINGSPSDNDAVVLVYPADYVGMVSSGTNFLPNPAFEVKVLNQGGKLEYIQNNLDIRGGMSQLAVSGSDATLKTSVKMSNGIVIWKLTLTDGSTPLPATKVTIKEGSDVQAATTTISPTSEVYLALPNIVLPSYKNLTIEATVGIYTFAYIAPGPVSVTFGEYYQSTVTMKKKKTIDLSTIATDYTAQDYEVLTGTLGSNVKISIADGATVTLKDADINSGGTLSGNNAGITCLGNATIILEGENKVQGFATKYPGIEVAESKTLTIMGYGSLDATGKGNAAGIGGGDNKNCGNIEIQNGTVTATGNQWGAGIGGGYNANCGNITISGGTVTATGGERAAGIGGGRRFNAGGSCGNITISGGTITATGGEDAAGIGGGRGNGAVSKTSCGTITITSGVTSVTATKGSSDAQSIGAGYLGTCGAVTIEDGDKVTQN